MFYLSKKSKQRTKYIKHINIWTKVNTDNYNKKSIMAFNAIYNAVKNYCSTSEKKYPGFVLQCDASEHPYIHIRVS